MILTKEQLSKFNGITVIPDVHGMYELYIKKIDMAVKKNYFIIQLGDIVDRGPEVYKCAKTTLELINDKIGIFVISNHDYKFAKYINSLKQNSFIVDYNKYSRENSFLNFNYDFHTLDIFCKEIEKAPTWIQLENHIFAHGAYYPYFKNDNKSRVIAMYDVEIAQHEYIKLPEFFSWEKNIRREETLILGHHVFGKNMPLYSTGEKGGTILYLDSGAYFTNTLASYSINIDKV